MRTQENLSFSVSVQPNIDIYQAYRVASRIHPVADVAYDTCISTRTENSKLSRWTHEVRIDLKEALFDA